MMPVRRESLLTGLVRSLVGLVLAVVLVAVALHWAYELLRPLLWLVVVISLVVVAVAAWRRWSGR